MADEKVALVTKVNTDLRALRDHLVGSRENPHLITLTTTLIRLTNTPEQNQTDFASEEQAQAAQKAAEQEAIKKQIAALQAKLS